MEKIQNIDGENKANIYDQMRFALGLGLSGNELKVLTTLLVEQDGNSGFVRGKSRDYLRAICDLGKTEYSTAIGRLAIRGLITNHRKQNAPQDIEINFGRSENPDVRKTRMSGKPGRSENPVSGRSENPAHLLYPTPVTTPVKELARARGVSGDWESGKCSFENGAIQLFNGERSDWLEQFGGDECDLDLALTECAAFVQQNSNRSLLTQVRAQLARKVRERRERDKRYQSAAKRNTQQKPETGAEILARRRARKEAEACANG